LLFSVIIPTYNRAEILRRNLNLLALQTYSDFEVIVIDDGSTDNTPRSLKEFTSKVKFPLKIISQKNRGQSHARNQGIAKAQGDIILFLGDDMLPANNLLAKHAEFHTIHANEKFACLGLVEWSPEIKITRFMRWLTRSGIQFKFSDLRKNSPVDFWRFYTANLSLKKKFLTTEKFCENFSSWGFEDAELGLRLQKNGMQLLFNHEAIVQHYHEITSDSLKDRQFSAGKNAVKFQKLHPNVKILPKGKKLFLQKLIATFLPFTYYGKAKKEFLRGIAEARKRI
jgi:glycosyltransferase involved in cell wall biosynthesis